MKTASRTILQFALVLTSTALVVLIVNNSRYKHLLEQLRAENARLSERLDQADKEPADRRIETPTETNHNDPTEPTAALDLFSWDIEAMKKKGLHDPASEITADLKQHHELIPYKGVLGGTMNFYDDSKIWVLTKKWVLAYFEDGHVAGYLLLEYEITQGGKIHWKTVASYIA
jgi:hypothetical protein